MNNVTPTQTQDATKQDKEQQLKEFTNTFYENLKCVEYEFGISRMEIAKVCKTSKAAVTQWFNKTNCPKMESVYLIAKRINRNPGDFFKKDGIHVSDNHKDEPHDKCDTLENTKNYFIANLNKLQSYYGYSKAQISQICHVSRPTVGQWFSRASWPKLVSLFYLADATNHTVGDFLKKDGIKPPDASSDNLPKPQKSLKKLSNNLHIPEDTSSQDAVSVLIANSEANNSISPNQLSPLERALIANFRIISPEGKKYILHALALEAKDANTKQKNASVTETSTDKS